MINVTSLNESLIEKLNRIQRTLEDNNNASEVNWAMRELRELLPSIISQIQSQR